VPLTGFALAAGVVVGHGVKVENAVGDGEGGGVGVAVAASGVADTTALGEEVVAFEQAATATRTAKASAGKPDDRVRLIWRDTSLECPNREVSSSAANAVPASPTRPVAAPGMSTAGPRARPADGS
jgi:hypothetical protein